MVVGGLVDELVLDGHLLAELAPDLSESQFVVRVDEAVQPHHVELILVLCGHVGYDRLDQLQRQFTVRSSSPMY